MRGRVVSTPSESSAFEKERQRRAHPRTHASTKKPRPCGALVDDEHARRGNHRQGATGCSGSGSEQYLALVNVLDC